MSDLSEKIYLFNDGEPISARWDGKDHELTDQPTEVLRGVAEHWVGVHKGAKLRIEAIPVEDIVKRKPVNPLEANDRGTAFAALKPKEPEAPEAPEAPETPADDVDKAKKSDEPKPKGE